MTSSFWGSGQERKCYAVKDKWDKRDPSIDHSVPEARSRIAATSSQRLVMKSPAERVCVGK
jgi:hypothetical protein